MRQGRLRGRPHTRNSAPDAAFLRSRRMRTLVQRVHEARVVVDGTTVGAIGRGLLVLAAIAADDTPDDRAWIARKVVDLRIFDDERGAMNHAVNDVGGEILAVSQFTLYASTRKGN